MQTSWQHLVHLGVALLGEATISRHGRQEFTLHDVGGDDYRIEERDGKLYCITCGEGLAEQDRHAALVLLYVLAIEGGGRLRPSR
jgi:hypothetical protein